MTKSTVKIYNCETNETIERDMTKEELQQVEIDKTADDLKRQAKEAKANDKAALLERLGITAEEAKLLLL
jgi:hypothetical protein